MEDLADESRLTVSTTFKWTRKRVLTSLFANIIITDARFRNRLPEPFDVPSHFNNFSISFFMSTYFAIVSGNWYAITHRGDSSDSIAVRTRMHMISIAGSLLVAANALAETRLGAHVPLMGSADPIDFWYGIAGATLGTTVAVEVHATNTSMET